MTDVLVRGELGLRRQLDTVFMGSALATQAFITPALAGLGDKVALLFS